MTDFLSSWPQWQWPWRTTVYTTPHSCPLFGH